MKRKTTTNDARRRRDARSTDQELEEVSRASPEGILKGKRGSDRKQEEASQQEREVRGLLVKELWRQPDEMIERIEQQRDPLRGIFMDSVYEATQEEVTEVLLPKVDLDLPKRKNRESGMKLSPPYLKAIHHLIETSTPLRMIQKRYNVSQVALRLHRDQQCYCRERGIVG